jgi:hypothetical protein
LKKFATVQANMWFYFLSLPIEYISFHHVQIHCKILVYVTKIVLTVQVEITIPDKSTKQFCVGNLLIIIYLLFGGGGDSVTRHIPEHFVCGETLSNIAMDPDKRKASSICMQRCHFCRLTQCNEIRLSL